MTEMSPLNSYVRVPLRVEDFLRLNDDGAFDDFARTELIDGDILALNSQYAPHAWNKDEIAFQLRVSIERAGLGHRVYTEATVAMPPHDAPAPDVAVIDAPLAPGPLALASLLLAVEIADSTAKFDLGRKAEMYARHGVPEYWVAELPKRRIVRHADPTGGVYARKDKLAFGRECASLTLLGAAVTVVLPA